MGVGCSWSTTTGRAQKQSRRRFPRIAVPVPIDELLGSSVRGQIDDRLLIDAAPTTIERAGRRIRTWFALQADRRSASGTLEVLFNC
ncbi:hypothetical protein [Paraburkholderia sp. 2C]